MFRNKMKLIPTLLLALVVTVVLLPDAAAADYSATIDYTNYSVTLGSDIGEYSMLSKGPFTAVSGSLSIDDTMLGKTLYFREAGGTKNVKTLKIPKRPTAPKPKVDYAKERLTGITAKMIITNASGTDITSSMFDATTKICDLASHIPASGSPDLVLHVKYAATNKAFESAAKEVIIPARPPAPGVEVKYDAKTNSIKMGSGYQIATSAGGPFTNMPATGYKLANVTATTFYIRKAPITSGSRAAFASEVMPPFILTTPAAPTGTISFISASDSITGVNDAFEYRVDSGSWVSVPKNATEVKIESRIVTTKPTTIEVRIKSSGGLGGSPASGAVSLSFTARAIAPEPTLNAIAETIENVDTTYEYRYGANGPFTPVTGSFIQLDTGKKTIQVRISGNDGLFSESGGTVTPASAYKSITIPAKLAKTSVAFDMSRDIPVFTKVESGLEYKIGDDPLWTKVENGQGYDPAAKTLEITDNMLGETVHFRRAALSNGTRLASPVQSLSIPDNASAPSTVYINYVNELIAGLTKAMEYRYSIGAPPLANDPWTACKAATLDISGWLDTAALTDEDIYFEVRRMATERRPESEARELTITGRGAPPTEVVFNRETEILEGISALYQYSINGGLTWKSATKDMSVSALTPNFSKPDTTLLIRLKPTTGAAGSKYLEFPLPARTAAADVTMNYFGRDGNGILQWTGKDDPSIVVEYRYGDDPTWYEYNDADFLTEADGSYMKLTSALKLHVRTKRDSDDNTITQSNSVTATISLTARPGIPALTLNYENEVITGVTSAMQWDKGSGWENIPAYAISASNLYMSAVDPNDPTESYDLRDLDVKFRYAATNKTFASFENTLDIAGVSNLPAPPDVDIKFDSETDMILGGVPRDTTDPLNKPLEYKVLSAVTGEIIKNWTTFPLYDGLDISAYIDATDEGIIFLYRYKASVTEPASASESLAAIGPRAAKPNAALDTLTEMITDVTTAMQYSLNGGSTWTDCTASPMSVADILSGKAQVMHVRIKGTPTVIASDSVEIKLPARANLPGVALDTNREIITGTTTAMEYSDDEGKTWTACTANMSYAPLQSAIAKKVLVRIKATGTTVASLSKELAIPAKL